MILRSLKTLFDLRVQSENYYLMTSFHKIIVCYQSRRSFEDYPILEQIIIRYCAHELYFCFSLQQRQRAFQLHEKSHLIIPKPPLAPVPHTDTVRPSVPMSWTAPRSVRVCSPAILLTKFTLSCDVSLSGLVSSARSKIERSRILLFGLSIS